MIKKKSKCNNAKPVNGLPIPYEPLMGMGIQEPVLDQSVKDALQEALVSFTHKVTWGKYGMNTLKKAGTAILLVGPPGTGKTTSAKWLAKKAGGLGLISITMADVGGSDPGSTERQTKAIFAEGKRKDNCPIFIDECDSILWSRDKAGPDSMWMLAVVNGFLQQIEQYPGLTILATNRPHDLDPALHRRLLAVIHLNKPNEEVRQILWQNKIPEEYPYQPRRAEICTLATFMLTGAEIENTIERATRRAIRQNRKPSFELFCIMAREVESEARGSESPSKAANDTVRPIRTTGTIRTATNGKTNCLS